jgi:hypothetical protein
MEVSKKGFGIEPSRAPPEMTEKWWMQRKVKVKKGSGRIAYSTSECCVSSSSVQEDNERAERSIITLQEIGLLMNYLSLFQVTRGPYPH